MESLFDNQLVRYLGVSNMSLNQLQIIFEGARIKPRFIQNRCFASQGWDRDVRQYCKEKDITYQGFSLLTANPYVMPAIMPIANRLNMTPAQVLFRFAQQIGMIPLTGTSSSQHMSEDLSLNFDLTDKELEFIVDVTQNIDI